MTGALNALSSSRMTWGGSADDEERMNRNGERRMISAFVAVPARMAWCIVGTALYHVGRSTSSHSKNRAASNPGGQATLDPAVIEESTAPMSPWMWNNGMIERLRSFGFNASVPTDRKSTRLNSSHLVISYAVFCLKKKKN